MVTEALCVGNGTEYGHLGSEVPFVKVFCSSAVLHMLQEGSHKAEVTSGARATVGSEALLGVEPCTFGDLPLAVHGTGGLDITTELNAFGFDAREALVTRSQLEGSDILLPKRFVQVCIGPCR
jgi:hypothetical protein